MLALAVHNTIFANLLHRYLHPLANVLRVCVAHSIRIAWGCEYDTRSSAIDTDVFVDFGAIF